MLLDTRSTGKSPERHTAVNHRQSLPTHGGDAALASAINDMSVLTKQHIFQSPVSTDHGIYLVTVPGGFNHKTDLLSPTPHPLASEGKTKRKPLVV